MSARLASTGRYLAAILPPLLLASADLAAQLGRIPEGFTPIFNGRDLTGWHPSLTTHQGTNADFSVEDGVLVLRQNPYGQGGVLLTDRKYGDFELYLEARPDWGTNGGIFFRSAESASAYQIELAGGSGGTGDLIGEMLRVTTSAQATRIEEVWRNEEWNSFRLRVVGNVPHVTLWVNDVLMWEVQAERNDLIADATEGMIGLQVHWSTTLTPTAGSFDMSGSWKPGAAHRFRNIGIRELEALTPASQARHPLSRMRERGTGGEGQRGARVTKQRTVTNPVGMEFVQIQPGSMVVGRFQPTCPAPPTGAPPGAAAEQPVSRGPRQDPRALWTPEDYRRCAEMVQREARPGFTVTIKRPYQIGRYEVTQAEWKRVMGTNPSVFQGSRVAGDSDRHPVDNVTWEDAQDFLARLNELDASAVYRLPTEWEWEYAARAGADEDLSWAEVPDYAWLALVDKGTTRPVGTKKPNAWGLHDMLGNVWEWVQDYYNHELFADPTPPRTGTVRVLRGGSFLGDVKNTTYFERGAGPGNGFDVGFRIVREPK
ncbi:hypothetical protein BH23GEM7_BH23GEM7_09090 [soil metagenome]